MPKKEKEKNLSAEFITVLAEASAGYLSEESFERLLNIFSSEIGSRYFPKSSESNLLRILASLHDKTTFLTDCLKFPRYAEIAVSISANSNYLTDIVVRNPEYLYWVSSMENLSPQLEKNSFQSIVRQNVEIYKSFETKINSLRRIKRREILRIGIKDILGLEEVEDITKELSVLASVITGMLFEICYAEVCKKYSVAALNNRYCLVALGKLGGEELNYSSDVDLIIFYDKNSRFKGTIEFHEILNESILLFINSASTITESGYIYRVDFRLRPDGRNSPLPRTMNDILHYYEARGEDWERQMLIKMNYAAGSKNLFENFRRSITPFIYPSGFTNSPLEQINRLKYNIEKKIIEEENLKLFSGGIRDIEFAVQALQLINGGKIEEVRGGNTIESIAGLKKFGLLSEEEYEALTSAYIFYRRIEHYLQLMNDRQTHTIPAGGELLEKLSSYLKFKSSKELKRFVSETREKIIKIYNSIFLLNTSDDYSLMKFNKLAFKNRTRALKNLEFLREGKGLLEQRQFDRKTIDSFQRIEKELFNYLGSSIQPDHVLENFARVIKSVKFPSIWYNEFTDKKFFISFLTLMDYSQKSVELFAEDENLRELFLTRRTHQQLGTGEYTKLPAKQLLFYLTVQVTLKIISHLSASAIMKDFFTSRISEIVGESIEKRFPNLIFFTGAMGSFGSGEMTLNSDIDLIFVCSNLSDYPTAQKEFQNLLQILRKEISPFSIDCRLRPEGQSGLLLWDYKKYLEYIRSRARVWELQASCKLSLVCGSGKLFSGLVTELRKRIGREKKEHIKEEFLIMRKKIYPSNLSNILHRFRLKNSPGGLLDIEFIIQYLILCSPDFYKKFRGKSTFGIIKSLAKNFKKYNELKLLETNYLFLKKLEFLLQNIFNSFAGVFPTDEERLKILANEFDMKDSKGLKTKLSQVVKSNRNLFQKYFG